MSSAILQLDSVSKTYRSGDNLLARLGVGTPAVEVRAVDEVSFAIETGTTFGLVGESGCGKSTIARILAGLLVPSEGSYTFGGAERTSQVRLQMIFQDPFSSLNPRWRAHSIIAEPLRQFDRSLSRSQIAEQVDDFLNQVGLSKRDGEKFPHQFSGGQKQRLSIARALAAKPEFLICDEPTSALDVSVQAQILNLLSDLQESLGLTMLFISHDLAVVEHISDRIGVMYLGQIVEMADTAQIFSDPQHPYTKLLIDAIPRLETRARERRAIAGEVPNPLSPPTGCHFHPRCPSARLECSVASPKLEQAKHGQVACHGVKQKWISKV